jgi:hypothetical protein
MAVSIASYGFDGMSYASNGKSLTDLAVSEVMDQDCASLRVFKVEWPCRDFSPEQQREAVIQKWRIAQHAKERSERYAKSNIPPLYRDPPVDTPDPPIPSSVIAEADAVKARAEQEVRLAELRKGGTQTVAAAVPAATDGEQADSDESVQDQAGGSSTELASTPVAANQPAGGPYDASETIAADGSNGAPSAATPASQPIQLASLPSAPAVATSPNLAVAVDAPETAPAAMPAVQAALAPAATLDLQAADSLNQLPITFVPPLSKVTAARKKTASAPAAMAVAHTASVHKPSAHGGAFLALASYPNRARAEHGMAGLAGMTLPLAVSRPDGESRYRLVSGPYAESQLTEVRAMLANAGYPHPRLVRLCRRTGEADCVLLDDRQVAHLTDR